MEIVIEKDIEIPDIRSNIARSVYPIRDMQIGDSFFVEAENKGVMVKRIRSAISHYTRHEFKDNKYTTRSVDGGVRCWRTK